MIGAGKTMVGNGWRFAAGGASASCSLGLAFEMDDGKKKAPQSPGTALEDASSNYWERWTRSVCMSLCMAPRVSRPVPSILLVPKTVPGARGTRCPCRPARGRTCRTGGQTLASLARMLEADDVIDGLAHQLVRRIRPALIQRFPAREWPGASGAPARAPERGRAPRVSS